MKRKKMKMKRNERKSTPPSFKPSKETRPAYPEQEKNPVVDLRGDDKRGPLDTEMGE